jgi:hypothetical protein
MQDVIDGAVVVVTSNIPPEEVENALSDISEVLGVPTREGYRVLLESIEPPVNVILNVADFINAIGVLYGAGSVCKRLYDKLSPRIERRLQIMFEVRDATHNVRYSVAPETPDGAIAMIAGDSNREVKGDGRMRFWIEEGWLTVEEYQDKRAREKRGD